MSSKQSSPPSAGKVLASVDDMRARIRQKRQLKGRQTDAESASQVRALIGEPSPTGYRRDLLIEYLHRLNDTYHALHMRHLVALAAAMKIGMAEVYEVATFYHHFEVLDADAAAPGLTVRVCSGLSCQLGGGAQLLQQLQTALGSADVRVIPAPCLGRCEQGPMAVVHQNPVTHADVRKVLDVVAAGATAHPAADDTGSFALAAQVERSVTCGPVDLGVAPAYVGLRAYQAQGGYALLAELVAEKHEAEHFIHVMESSGLRGLGGAGFPAGRKWRIVRRMDGPRMMAVNIDEGEPGTFKDRTYLERDPHRFLEGLLIAARVVGVQSCYIYLRDEYHGCRAILETELEKLRAQAPFPLPHIELRRGAGAYICGEESAMIESIEGKRGEPRKRPPYIASVGVFGHPTLEHNFETLYWVRDILERGPEWFSGFGRNGRKGLRSYSVSGRVRSPGVKLAPAGISVRELIAEYCDGMLDGHTLYAYLPGGASGGILPARLADEPLDFDTLQPHGCFIGSAAVIVLSQHDRARDAALNMLHFFADESCGQCTPCRVGTAKAAQLMQAPVWDNETLEDLNQVMTDASICGLGQAAPNPIRSVQKYFAQEIR
jgi:formate dehydrogenase beta subunit